MTIILDGCERLTLPATNALLKTLEEAGPRPAPIAHE
jgi:DNA polymerase III gamma/tau subunit